MEVIFKHRYGMLKWYAPNSNSNFIVTELRHGRINKIQIATICGSLLFFTYDLKRDLTVSSVRSLFYSFTFPAFSLVK